MLILASNSPRRKEILEMLGYEFEIRPSDTDENIENLSPEQTVEELSFRKALAVERKPEDIVIGSDTIVSLDDEILGKPKNDADAKRMLSKLSGRAHTVYTGVTILQGEKIITNAISAKVYFRELTQREIERYVSTGEPLDKAGAYGIQGKGAAFIEKIDGDYYAVMGLPACYVSKTLSEIGYYPKG